jgi:hypothetical protein
MSCSVKYPVVKQQGREADRSHQSNDEANNAWSYLHSFMMCTLTSQKRDFEIMTLQSRLKTKTQD